MASKPSLSVPSGTQAADAARVPPSPRHSPSSPAPAAAAQSDTQHTDMASKPSLIVPPGTQAADAARVPPSPRHSPSSPAPVAAAQPDTQHTVQLPRRLTFQNDTTTTTTTLVPSKRCLRPREVETDPASVSNEASAFAISRTSFRCPAHLQCTARTGERYERTRHNSMSEPEPETGLEMRSQKFESTFDGMSEPETDTDGLSKKKHHTKANFQSRRDLTAPRIGPSKKGTRSREGVHAAPPSPRGSRTES
jgi:hypothetical protein